VLEIEAVALRYFIIDSLLHPINLINHFVAPRLQKLTAETILGIDNPNENKSIIL